MFDKLSNFSVCNFENNFFFVLLSRNFFSLFFLSCNFLRDLRFENKVNGKIEYLLLDKFKYFSDVNDESILEEFCIVVNLFCWSCNLVRFVKGVNNCLGRVLILFLYNCRFCRLISLEKVFLNSVNILLLFK